MQSKNSDIYQCEVSKLEEQDIFLNRQHNYQNGLKKNDDDHMRISNSMCRSKQIIRWIYAALVIIIISIACLNVKIYNQYTLKQFYLETSLDTAKQSIILKQQEMQNDVDRFTQQYKEKYQKIVKKYVEVSATVESIRQQFQFRNNSLQLLFIKNSQNVQKLNEITKKNQVFSKELKQYYKGSQFDLMTAQKNTIGSNGEYYTKIEPIVWVFTQNYVREGQYLRKLYLNNVKYYSYLSNFEIKFINQKNYFYYLSKPMVSKVSSILSLLQLRLSNKDQTNLVDHFGTIKKVMIMMSLLVQHGGVIIIDHVALTQPLNWIHDMDSLKDYNHQIKNMPLQVITFFNKHYCSQKMKIDSEFFKEIYQFPGIQRFFLAAVKKSEFIKEMLDEMIKILQNPTKIQSQISNNKYDMGELKGKDPYYQFFYIAGHIVLQKKQKQLDESNPEKKLYAIDYYGLYSINTLLGPVKLKSFFKSQTSQYISHNLIDISKAEFQRKIGPIKFMHIFYYYEESNKLMLQIKNGRRKIVKGSFVHSLFYQGGDNKAFEKEIKQKYEDKNKHIIWQRLSRKIWIYERNFDEISKLLMKSNQKLNRDAEFEVEIIDKNSIELFLSGRRVSEINNIFKESRFSNSFLRQYTLILQLLVMRGGVYLDSSYLLLENLQWLRNINQINPEMIANRFGQTPELFMFHNQHLTRTFQYSFDEVYHSRTDNRLMYEGSFIAAVKESEFLKEWIDNLLKGVLMSEDELGSYFLQCGLKDDVLHQLNSDYLAMDILRCTYRRGLGKVSKEQYGSIKNPYRLWSVDGDYGVYKISENTNYQNADEEENKYLVKYGQAEAEKNIGDIFKLIRLDKANLKYLKQIYSKQGKSYQYIHKQSIFAKYLLERL